MRIYNLIKVFLLAGILIFFGWGSINPVEAAGASLYLAPSTGTKLINSKFSVAVKVNTGGQVINASQGTISFDTNLLEAVGASKGGSIFTLWTVDPNFSNSAGTINFGGGVPQPGYSGTAGTICTVTFRAKKVGTAAVRFTSGAVLANDGKGTNILASMGSASFTISPYVEAPKQPPKPEKKVEPEYNKPKISSPTHPDQEAWYKLSDVKLIWGLPESVNGVSLSFNESAFSDPGSISDGLFAAKDYEAVEDGVWYFHLKFKDSKRWGTVAHYRVGIDTKPPEPFKIEVETKELGEWPILHFKTTDDGSGIDHYEVFIDTLEAEPFIVEADKNSFQPSDLGGGEHTALVKAVDKAGNETVATEKFRVEPIEAPTIEHYAQEIKSSDRFFMNGTALSNVTIDVFIKKGEDVIVTDKAASDQGGNWFYVNNEGLPNGRYVAWVEAVNDKGIRSEPSNTVSFLVTPPVFARIGGFIINYFTVLVSLLFLILLIIALILFLIAFYRRRLKKETKDIERVLEENLEELKKDISKDIAGLGSQEKAKVKSRISKRIDEAKSKILKEIKDIEELFKL